MPTKHFPPKRYIYLDVAGIESLYAQTVNRLETEFSQGTEKEKGGKVGAKIGIGQALRVLLGLVDINAETEISLSGKTIEEAKSHLTTEHKLTRLLQYLKSLQGELFFEDLTSAAQRCHNTGESVFVHVRDEFNLPQFYPGRDGVTAVNKLKYVLFEIGEPLSKNAPIDHDTYDSSDDYFKPSPKPRVVMSASLAKFPNVNDLVMGMASHEAVLFGGYGGQRLPLSVFGDMVSLKIFFQIKPYAIAL